MSSVNTPKMDAMNSIDRFFAPSQHSISEGRSIAPTAVENSPWIQVDLMTSYSIYGVKIWQRSECSNPSKSSLFTMTINSS